MSLFLCGQNWDFTLDFYFRQFWTDPRLGFRKKPGVETLSVGSDFIKNIWVPDTFFVNEKQSYFHIATTSNEFIRIHHSGSITRSIRVDDTLVLRAEKFVTKITVTDIQKLPSEKIKKEECFFDVQV
ncbi:hypothetical protein RUM43_002873 [Polyplax serrata]|uniref:Neurotransmitter-gated ion-channel ligand-binding domain-containing protein n=1 Tax=Polyplax serrata TaxID=468196 RepID=A0AAN8P031_POLSC